MISANVYGVTDGWGDAIVRNCYTISKIDWNDYTASADDPTGLNIYVVKDKDNDTEVSGIYYDIDGLNFAGINSANATGKKYSEMQTNIFGEQDYSNDVWLSDINFNYGYPTLRYGYTKYSSWATRAETARGDGYDAHIMDGTYTRLENGATPSGSDNFFMIPNVGVLANMANIAGDPTNNIITGNFALLYDIDWTQRTANSEGFVPYAFIGKFDGREKTISYMQENLFTSIGNDSTSTSSTWVRNLRLTNAESTTGGILTNSIVKATVSNMTISGKVAISSGEATTIGALANSANGAIVETITNLAEISYNGGQDIKIGGIVGYTETNSTISYCSNYGIINVLINTTNKSPQAGGIVGYADTNTTIEYSFNAGSITNGYASTSGMATQEGNFYAGGIAGYANGTKILSSYNSGMVKAGNKSNTKVAYAGGIIGNGSTMTITDCYNQGSVEALGDNPTFEWKWEKNSDTGNVLALTLRQTNARNVWAYGIGHISGTITNSIVKTTTSDDANNASIYNNGTIADSGNMLKHWLWSTIEATITKFDTIEQTAKRMIHLVLSKDYRYAQFKYKATPVEPTTSTTPTVVVTSVDELEIPTAFVLKTQTKININYRRGEWEDLIIIPAGELGAVWWMSWLFNGDAGEDITIDEHYTYDYADASTDYYNKYVGNVTNKFSSITFDSSNRIGEGESGSAIMKNTRSSVDDEERSTIKIANQDYYLADKDNLTTIFNAGIYEYSGTYSSSTLPYFANTDYYSISATFAGRSVGAKIMSVEKTASGISIKYIAYDEDPLTGGNLSVTISVNYSESVTINTSSLNFIYTGNYSVGIRKINDISDFDAVKITAGYSIYSQADNSVKYTDIIKLSVASVASGSQPSDDDESLIYLAHDGEKYIYIPNAKLHETENGENYAGDLVVNNIGFTSLGSGTTFVTNVNKIKALFNGKTMYVRTATEESTYASVSYGNSGKGSYEFVGQGSQSVSKTISYGKTVSVAKSIAFGGSEGDYYYSATMSSPGEDVLALKDGSPVISYKHSTTTWGLGVSTINIAGTEMNVSVSGNKILFKSESLTGANSTIQSGINSYFNSLTWIANEEVTEVFSDNFSSMTSGTKSISLGSAGYLNIELEVNKGWTYSNPYGLTITQGNALTIKVAKNNPDLDIYSLNGVAINKGSLSFSATQSYETSITQYILMNSNSNDSYYKIELVENGVTTETIEHVGASGSHVDGYLGDAWKDFSASTIKVSAQISGTYQITKDDKDNFHIVARDDSGKLFYIEGLLSDDACAVTYISQLVKARSGDDILVAQNISGDSTIGYTISYLVNNKPILALGYSTAGISDSNLTTVYMYDNNGEGYSVALSDWREGSDYVTFKLGDESYSITKTQMETMTPFTTYQNCVTFYEQSDIKYLVLDPELTDVQSYNYVLEGETYPYKTEIERNVYAWETCTFPTSDEYVFAKFSFYSGDWSKMNIDYGSLKYIVTDQANCGVKAILADDADDRITVNVTVKTANKTGSANKAISVDSPLEPLSIILTTDISFNDIGAGFSKASSVNIIGEGYYISYCGETLYNSMSGGTTNAFIRDVSFLGETYNKSLLVGSEINKTDLYNVSLYGSVNALTNKTALIADSAPSADYTIDNFTNFASVQSVASEGTILLDVATMTASTNKGVVTALDGVHGEKGADGTNDSANISNRNGKNGTDGGKGAGIKATSVESSITFENQGILYSGNGGNGGAGGSGYKGTDKLTDNGRNNTAGSAGSAGVAGEIGDITGFSAGGTSISKKGFDGTNGARARRGFGYLSTKRTSSFAGINEDNSVSGYSYQGDSFGYEYLEHDDTAGKAQANDIYTKMFRLAGDYTTALPTPGEGAWK